MMTKGKTVKEVNDKSRCLECKKLFPYIIGGNFVDLKKNGWLPRKDLDRIDINTPINWDHPDDNACFNLHAWRFMSAVWAHYIKEPCYQSAHEAVFFNLKIMKDWKFNNKKYSEKYVWYDMSAAFRAFHIAFTSYLLRSYDLSLNLEDKNFFNHLVIKHISWLANSENITDGNHAIYQIVALRTLEYVIGLNDNITFSEEKLEDLLDSGFDSLCVSTENSPFYHQYNLQILNYIPREIFPNLEKKISEILIRGKDVEKWLTAPNGFFYRIGDTEGKGLDFSGREPFLSECTMHVGEEKYIYKDFFSSGYQIFRSHPDEKLCDAFSFIFHGTNKSPVHNHSDKLSFICFFNNIEVFADPGKYSYENSDQRKWILSDASHNTVGKANTPVLPKDISIGDVEIQPLDKRNDHMIFKGSVDKSLNFSHTRNIYVYPKRSIHIVDTINNTSNVSSELRYLLGDWCDWHSEGKQSSGLYRLTVKSKSSIIASVDVYPPPSDIYISKTNSETSFISKNYKKRDFASQIKLIYPSSTKLVETNILFHTDKSKANAVSGEKYTQNIILGNGFYDATHAHIFSSIPVEFSNKNIEFACYFYVNDEKKETCWYQDSSYFYFEIDKSISKAYSARVFVRDKDSIEHKISSTVFRIPPNFNY